LQTESSLDELLEAHRQGDFGIPINGYQRFLAGSPERIDVWHLYGLVKVQVGEKSEGLLFLARAAARHPLEATIASNLGSALLESTRTAEAVYQLQRAVALDCSRSAAYLSLGHALRQSLGSSAAVVAYRQALVLQPRAETAQALATCLSDTGDRDGAISLFRFTLALAPHNALVLNNFALALGDSGQGHAARSWIERALRVEQFRLEFLYNHACLLYDLRMLNQAVDEFTKVIELDGDHAKAHWNRANLNLALGNFAEGWRDFAWRWRAKHLDRPFGDDDKLDLATHGNELSGKSVVLQHEQGLGDTLQFCRYVRPIALKGAKVVMQVPSPLVRLLSGQSLPVQVVPLGDPLPVHDLSCALMSLPLAFGTTLETIPYGGEAYLHALPEDVERWGERLGERNRPRVGLVWNGGFRADQPELWAVNERRNVPLELFAQALDIAGIDFVSLQKGDPAESEIRGREGEYWKRGRLYNYAGELTDFADTAGLIANLDLVISVDTSTAHLSAAMGKPTWILNRYDTCWRWLLDREDSPWYGSVKLYRQGADRDWRPVLQRVATDLSSMLRSMR